MLKIGLTGGIGSGKSAAAGFFAELGVQVIDADQISRELVVPDTFAYNKIVDHFGNNVLQSNEHLDRRYLRQIIFEDTAQKAWLEALLHPLILEKILSEIAKITASYCIIIMPLLFETHQEEYVDRILVVDCEEEQQIAHIVQRDRCQEAEVKAIIASQISRKERLAKADDIITNDKDLSYLKQQVGKFHRKYLIISQKVI